MYILCVKRVLCELCLTKTFVAVTDVCSRRNVCKWRLLVLPRESLGSFTPRFTTSTKPIPRFAEVQMYRRKIRGCPGRPDYSRISSWVWDNTASATRWNHHRRSNLVCRARPKFPCRSNVRRWWKAGTMRNAPAVHPDNVSCLKTRNNIVIAISIYREKIFRYILP